MAGRTESSGTSRFVSVGYVQLSQGSSFPVQMRSTGSNGLSGRLGHSKKRNEYSVSAEESEARALEVTAERNDFFYC